MKKIVIYGAGGFGREMAFMIERINSFEPTYEILGFVDDGAAFPIGMDINGYPVVGKGDWLLEHKEVACACAIANVHVRKKLFEKYMAQGVEFETIIAPGIDIHKSTTIGKGCVICRECRITVNVVLEDGVFLNSGVAVGHDAHIGTFTTIFPNTGISGYCQVGSEVTIGGHAFIVPEKKIGDNAIVAAGSIVFSNVKAGTTVLGNPAKRLKALEE